MGNTFGQMRGHRQEEKSWFESDIKDAANFSSPIEENYKRRVTMKGSKPPKHSAAMETTSMRLRMAHKMLSSDSDEEITLNEFNSVSLHQQRSASVIPNHNNRFAPGSSAAPNTQAHEEGIVSTEESRGAAPEATGSHPFMHDITSRRSSGTASVSSGTAMETRIVAPNVSKLSPCSAVEVRLQSATECVAILCAVDVLKMRSTFFHDLLCEQEVEKNVSRNSLGTCASESVSAGRESSIAFPTTEEPSIMWRTPIAVPEPAPYEAAAFLESLHEGRALFRGDWNYCWARLRYEEMILGPSLTNHIIRDMNFHAFCINFRRKCRVGNR